MGRKRLNGREYKALFILSLVVPFGLLAAFRLTGILEEPEIVTISEIITLDVVGWEFERPSCIIHFGDNVESQYFDDVSINETIFVDDYWPDAGEYGFSPLFEMGLTLTASLAEGHIESVNITFYDEYLNSLVIVPDLECGGKNHTLAVWYNLTATSYNDWLRGIEKAFVNLKGVNHPKTVYLRIWPDWVLRSPHNQTQKLTIWSEVTYFNGTAYKKVIQPFELKLVPDDNNSFENAEEIIFGQPDRRCMLGGDDKEDFYKVYLGKDEIIHVTMTPPQGLGDFDLYLYNPTDRNSPATSSTQRRDAVESINYKADTAGWWSIRVQQMGGFGIYTLTLTTAE